MKHSVLHAILLGFCCLPASAAVNLPATNSAEQTPTPSDHYSDTLLGNWGDRRSALMAQGYDWQAIYKLDLLNNISSHADKVYGLDHLDLKLNLDFEKISGFKGVTAFLHIISNRGDKPAQYSNRLPHGVDNIETPVNGNTTKLFQAWVQQSLLDDKVSVLLGLYDLNAEFYVTESSAMFIHPTFGIGAELADTGKNGPSIFPTTSVALRVKTEPSPGYYLQAITLDGVPGDPDDPQGTHIKFDSGDGTLNVIEGGIPLGDADTAHGNKLAFGLWQYTAMFNDWQEVDAYGNPVQRINHGAYAILEKVLQYSPESPDPRIRSFLRIGKANGDVSQFDFALSAGLVFSGLLPGHEQNELGIAYAQECNSAKYRAASGNPVFAERSLELGYRHYIMPGLWAHPFIQYLHNHSNDPVQDQTWWLGIRLEAML